MCDYVEQNLTGGNTPVTEENRTLRPEEQGTAPVRSAAPVFGTVTQVENVPVQPVVSAPAEEAPSYTAPVQEVPVQPVYAPVQPEPVYTAPVQQEPVYVQEVPEQPVYAPVQDNNCTYHQAGAAGSYGAEPQPQPVYNAEVHQQYAAQNGYDQTAYSYGYAPGAAPGKKKMKTGAKVFLIILLVCAILSLVALVGVGVYTFVSGGSEAPVISGTGEPVNSVPPTNSLPGTPVTPPSSSEQENDPSSSSEVIDITPTDGIEICAKSGQPLSAQEAYNRVVNSTVLVKVSFVDANGNAGEGTGSGVIATEDGYIITNSHVVKDSRNVNVQVITYTGEEYSAVVVGYDRTTDLAVIKVNAHGLQPATFGAAAEMSVGEQVITIGNPGGEHFSFSMTGGYISGLDRHVGSYSSAGMTYIQTDAAINPGNSGGALVNMYGQVVGINSSKIVADGYESMGFSIPVDKAQTIICDLMTGGYVTGRVRLGISGRDVTDAQVYNFGVPYGFVIVSMEEDSAFAGTGVQAGDIITAIDGDEIKNLNQLSHKLLEYAPGDKVTVTLYRLTTSLVENTYAGQYFNIEVTLLADNGETQVN